MLLAAAKREASLISFFTAATIPLLWVLACQILLGGASFISPYCHYLDPADPTGIRTREANGF